MSKEPKPMLAADEVVRRVKKWLEDPGNVEQLKEVFDRADKHAKELTRRTMWPPVEKSQLDGLIRPHRQSPSFPGKAGAFFCHKKFFHFARW